MQHSIVGNHAEMSAGFRWLGWRRLLPVRKRLRRKSRPPANQIPGPKRARLGFSACSGSGRSKITVANGSNQSSFNNTWIEITIPLGTTYGASGLWQGGWWQVQYNVTAGNDTTTWSVNVRGNPVHLVPVGVG